MINLSEVFFPFYRTIYLRTKVSKEEVALRLRSLVKTSSPGSKEIFYFSSPGTKKGKNTGFVEEDRASILTLFRPKTGGEIHGDTQGTSIRLVFKMNAFTNFLAVVVCLPLLMLLIQQLHLFQFPPQLLGLGTAGVFSFLLICYIYRLACKSASKIIARNLNASEFTLGKEVNKLYW